MLLGRRASLLFPAYFPIQSLQQQYMLVDGLETQLKMEGRHVGDNLALGSSQAYSFKGCRVSVSVMTLLSPRTSRKKFLSLSSSVAKLSLRLAAAVLALRTDCRQTGAILLLSRSICKAACIVLT